MRELIDYMAYNVFLILFLCIVLTMADLLRGGWGLFNLRFVSACCSEGSLYVSLGSTRILRVLVNVLFSKRRFFFFAKKKKRRSKKLYFDQKKKARKKTPNN